MFPALFPPSSRDLPVIFPCYLRRIHFIPPKTLERAGFSFRDLPALFPPEYCLLPARIVYARSERNGWVLTRKTILSLALSLEGKAAVSCFIQAGTTITTVHEAGKFPSPTGRVMCLASKDCRSLTKEEELSPGRGTLLVCGVCAW